MISVSLEQNFFNIEVKDVFDQVGCYLCYSKIIEKKLYQKSSRFFFELPNSDPLICKIIIFIMKGNVKLKQEYFFHIEDGKVYSCSEGVSGSEIIKYIDHGIFNSSGVFEYEALEKCRLAIEFMNQKNKVSLNNNLFEVGKKYTMDFEKGDVLRSKDHIFSICDYKISNFNVDIIGSCVARDMYRILDLGSDINYYIARQKMQLYVEESLNIEKNELLGSSFSNRVIYETAERFVINRKTKTKNILIDLTDERLKLIDVKGFGIIPWSTTLKDTKFLNHKSFDFIDSDIQKVKEGIKIFFESYKEHNIYCIAPVFASSDISQEVSFEVGQLESINEVYAEIKKNKNLEILNLPSIVFSDAKHMWTSAPYHYYDYVYICIYKNFLKTLENDSINV